MNYLPFLEDEQGNRWEVLQMDWCVDFGGRQCQIECQRNNGDGTFPIKSFVIYGKDGDFRQWDRKVGNHKPVKGMFYKSVMDMFLQFDTTDTVKKVA